MNKAGKIIIVTVLVILVGLVIVLKKSKSLPPGSPAGDNSAGTLTSKSLPRLVELGGNCTVCKMMAPILGELTAEYAGSLRVDVFNAIGNTDIATEYEVQIFPTQIFFDASGKELFRHEGFFPKEDILAKWKELGVELEKAK